MIDLVLIGLIEAAPLVLAAIGFTLIYYLNGFINVAFAETITSGAYFAVFFNQVLGLGFYLAIIPAAIAAGLLSVATYLLVYRPALNRGVGVVEMIVLSVGVSFLLRHLLRVVFGVETYLFDLGEQTYLSILGTGVTSVQIWALVLVVVMVTVAYLMTYRSKYGQMMRALASNRDLAVASGIDPTKASILVWFIAGVAGGLAGIFLGVFAFVDYQIGWNLILIIVMVAIVGGIGNVRGALIAGAAAGVAVSFLTWLTQPLYAQVLLLALFIVVLRLKATRSGGGSRRSLLALAGRS
ncbi:MULTISPECIES: branched-chain amino acid ABC transporter permease [Mycolicibacterium]|uniref:ABC-type branched-chain amino acid transport system, permease protein I n=2 Tax=Mycolicibacterium TaxID=1866885 RepID=A0A378TKD7_9MYCO|nr:MULTISPECIES: branched-chain amino acid ABC transporter permease [Mycolicibacterium]MCV7185505.1 branched-chain amino acid ABC transporter permease [Mycolicibacterium murale]BBY84222.1 branched-chain amino acid ABC transporter permease [Mycolicibacterium tokaiense]GFG58157.1 branched-chain amino acid ABC transporter permease [Mycolicibacterium murale]STZ61272.1 ABC-type branched-chain amino acid transport system, permease protein I [Mycolicibacterium tokaiense]